MRAPVFACLSLALFATVASAQHEHHAPAPAPTPAPTPGASAAPSPAASPEPGPSPATAVAAHEGHGAPASPTLFQSDMATMTGRTARDPMGGMDMPGWSFMTMGIARLQYNHQGGPSGDTAVESSNWSMVMAQRDVSGARVSLMMMNSVEPATFGGGGTPELFQTGEAYEGRPLVDRQHPHDFFMNLSATARWQVGAGAVWVVAAPVGEPALGPAAFMHRASAGENPTAPLGHHWQDSTHIANEVITVGGARGRVTLEASAFHGREPDERRWNIDTGAPDSVSGRVRLDLGRGWSGQVSYGFLNEPEALAPGDTRRTTASVEYGAKGDRPFAATLVFGRNAEEHGTTDAWLAEAGWQLTRRDQVFARAERVAKDRHLLAMKTLSFEPPLVPGAAGPPHEDGETVDVGAFTIGYLRDHPLWRSVHLGLGADLTVYGAPSDLQPAYGDTPIGLHVFGRLRWGRPHGSHAMGDQPMNHGM